MVVTAESQWIDIDGPIHYVDYGGPAGATTMVMVHGLMGAHVNWLSLTPELTDEFWVIALDLVGHGRTPRAGRGTDVRSNRQVLHRFLTHVVGEPAVLVGNSMGGLISILQAAGEPETVRGLILIAPALPAVLTEIPSSTFVLNYLPLAVPGLGTALLHAQQRTSNAEGLIRSLFEDMAADPGRVSEEVIREHIELAEARLQISETSAGYQAAAQSTLRMMLQVRDYSATIGRSKRPCFSSKGNRTRLFRPRVPARSLPTTRTGTSRASPESVTSPCWKYPSNSPAPSRRGLANGWPDHASPGLLRAHALRSPWFPLSQRAPRNLVPAKVRP